MLYPAVCRLKLKWSGKEEPGLVWDLQGSHSLDEVIQCVWLEAVTLKSDGPEDRLGYLLGTW